MPFSVTAEEKTAIKRRARKLGFANSSRYLLALVEAEQRLMLPIKEDEDGNRWFVLNQDDPIPAGKNAGSEAISDLADKLQKHPVRPSVEKEANR